MIVGSDLAAGISTQFEAWALDELNGSVPVEETRFSGLILPLNLPDFSGNRINLNWLGAAPQMREWVDEKRALGLNKFEWEILVKNWEATIGIDLRTFVDARWSMYEPRIREMVQNARRHRYNLISDLIRLGESQVCYDGQYFFDTDHSEGDSGTQSNEVSGTGTSLAQVRTDYFTAKSKLMQFKDDKGEYIWAGDFRPLLWVPADPTLMERFEELRGANVTTSNSTGGNTNILQDAFDIVYDPKLTDANDWHMFNPMGSMKPFVSVNREEFHYEDNFGTGHPDVWSRRVGEASVVGRDNMTYGMWQKAAKVKNS